MYQTLLSNVQLLIRNHVGAQRLNVLGFLKRESELTAYTFEGSVNKDVGIACIDEFSNAIKASTVLVIDNATIPISNSVVDGMPFWRTRNLELFYLPPYSLQFNLIEILWRFIKYQWIDCSAYNSFHNLVEYVDNSIRLYRTDYQINFV